jgi:hypothetical protein
MYFSAHFIKQLTDFWAILYIEGLLRTGCSGAYKYSDQKERKWLEFGGNCNRPIAQI